MGCVFDIIDVLPISGVYQIAECAQASCLILPDMAELVHQKRLDEQGLSRKVGGIVLPI